MSLYLPAPPPPRAAVRASHRYRQEARLRDIVSAIQARAEGKERVICISGPTSSGKATFAAKLCRCESAAPVPFEAARAVTVVSGRRLVVAKRY